MYCLRTSKDFDPANVGGYGMCGSYANGYGTNVYLKSSMWGSPYVFPYSCTRIQYLRCHRLYNTNKSKSISSISVIFDETIERLRIRGKCGVPRISSRGDASHVTTHLGHRPTRYRTKVADGSYEQFAASLVVATKSNQLKIPSSLQEPQLYSSPSNSPAIFLRHQHAIHNALVLHHTGPRTLLARRPHLLPGPVHRRLE